MPRSELEEILITLNSMKEERPSKKSAYDVLRKHMSKALEIYFS